MSEADVEQLKAEIANLKGQMSAFAMSETSGIDYMTGWSCQDDSEIPNVPIGGSGSSGPFEWDGEKRKIGPGGVMVGRDFISCPESNEGMSDGEYCVKVTITESSGTVEIEKKSFGAAPDDEKCWIPIYRIKDGKVDADMRGAFAVQCWE